jgi:hypothetical protein
MLIISNFLQESFKTPLYIIIGLIKVPCVPGISHISVLTCKREQEADLSLRISTAYPAHIANVIMVHAYKKVKSVIVHSTHKPGSLFAAGYSQSGKYSYSAVMHRISNLLCACGRRLYIKPVGKASFSHHILH